MLVDALGLTECKSPILALSLDNSLSWSLKHFSSAEKHWDDCLRQGIANQFVHFVVRI